MHRRITTLVVALLAYMAFACAPARAALFTVRTNNGVFIPVGESVPLVISIIPEEGDKVVGGSCTLTVDPEYLELSDDRNEYAADPALNLVKRFKVDPEKGIVTFNAKSASPLDGRKIFIRVPVKMKKNGPTRVVFSSAALFEDNTQVPSNTGYFRLYGSDGKEVDPLLYASFAGDNSLLTTGSLKNSYQIKRTVEEAQIVAAAASGMATQALDQAATETDADVIVEFSKSRATIGKGEYVRLDIMITKFPEDYKDQLAGFEARIKYDPKYLKYVNRMGREVTTVDVNKNLDLLELKDLKTMAKNLEIPIVLTGTDGDPKTDDELKIELRDQIKQYQGDIDDTLFTFSLLTPGYVGSVDNGNGTIDLNMVLDMGMWNITNLEAQGGEEDEEDDPFAALEATTAALPELTFPQKVMTLIFRGTAPGQDLPIIMENVRTVDPQYLPNATQLVKPAYITVDPKHEGCDQTLPTALCTGSFEVTGNLELRIEKQREIRKEQTPQRDANGNPIYVGTVLQTEQVTFIREKYNLLQTWNVFLSGSLRNGIRVDGSIHKAPLQEQRVDLELFGNEGYLHLGDFTSTFPGTSKINFLKKPITGLQLGYNFGNFSLSGLMAEGRSEQGKGQIIGDGTKGPYTFSSNDLIIAGTVQLTYWDSGVVVPPSSYTIDTASYEVKFKEPLSEGSKVDITYEKSTFVFSTGNLIAAGLGYDSQQGTNKKERLTVDTAFSLSAAPKGETKPVYQTTQTFDSADLERVYCPDQIYSMFDNPYPGSILEIPEGGGDAACLRVELSHDYIVESDSLIITYKGKTYTENDKEDVITLHRTWLKGYFYVRYSSFTGSFSVKYSYYNQTLLQRDRIRTVAEFDSDIDLTTVTINRNLWPEDVISGSEIIYLSKDSSEVLGDNDYVACMYNDDQQHMEWDSLFTFCNEQMAPFSLDWYEIDVQSDYVVLTFRSPRQLTNYSEYKYVKVQYQIVPSEEISSSEFTKTALGMDMKWVATDDLTVTGQYARTRSDLSSKYSSYVDEFTVDAQSTNPDGDFSGEKCEYSVVAEQTSMEMKCKLANTNIQTPILIKINFCLREGEEYPDKQVWNTANSYCQTKSGISGDDSQGYELENQDYYITSNHPMVSLDKTNGYITFTRTREIHVYDGGSDFVDKYFYDQDDLYDDIENQPFLTEGDFLSISYQYAEAQQELVDGDIIDLALDYKGKWLDFYVSKSDKDPFFDSSFQGRLQDSNTNATDKLTTKTTVRMGDEFTFNYNTAKSEQTKLQGKVVSSATNLDSVSYSFAYATKESKNRLRAFKYSRSTQDNRDRNLLDTSKVNKTTTTTDYNYKFNFWEGLIVTSGTYQDTNATDFINPDANNERTIARTFDTEFYPRPNLTLKTAFTRSKTPLKEKRSRTNKYSVVYSPFSLLSMDLTFDRSIAKKGADQPVQLTENNTYVAKITKSLYRMSNIQYTITQNRLPRQLNQVRRERADKRVLKFDLKIANPLTLTPSYTRDLNIRTNWKLSRNLNWKLTYDPKTSRSFNVSWNRNEVDEKSATFSDADVLTDFDEKSTVKNTYTMKIKPVKTHNLSTTYETYSARSGPYDKISLSYDILPTTNTFVKAEYSTLSSESNPSRDLRFKYTYSYTSKINFLTEWGRKVSGQAASTTRVTDYDFTTNYQLNPKTNLYVTYKDRITRSESGTSVSSSDPRFVARLNSKF